MRAPLGKFTWRMLATVLAGQGISIMLGAVVAFQIMAWLHPETVAGATWGGMAALVQQVIGRPGPKMNLTPFFTQK